MAVPPVFPPPTNMAHTKLYIPGPIEVSAKTFAAMTQPMIGHRSKDFQALYGRIMPMLQQTFVTKQPVFISTSSAWGVMEGSIRNLVAKKVLNCCCGAFSDKWYDVSLACGKQAEALKVEWGQPITPEAVDAALSKGGFDAITLVHSETSTGVLNPLKEIVDVVKKYPDVLLITDTVSSFSTVPTPFDEPRELLQLRHTDSGLHVGCLEVVADVRVDVLVVVTVGQIAQLPVEALAARVLLPRLAPAVTAPIAERFENGLHLRRVREHASALAHRDVMGGIEAHRREIAERPDVRTTVR